MTHLTREELSMWASGDLSPQDRVRMAAHIQGCQTCIREAEGFTRLMKSVQDLPKVSAPRELASLVRARMHESRRPWALFRIPHPAFRTIFRSPFAWSGVAGAALVLLLVWSQSRQGTVATLQEVLREEGTVSSTLIGTGATVGQANIPKVDLGKQPLPQRSVPDSTVVPSDPVKTVGSEVVGLTLTDSYPLTMGSGKADLRVGRDESKKAATNLSELAADKLGRMDQAQEAEGIEESLEKSSRSVGQSQRGSSGEMSAKRKIQAEPVQENPGLFSQEKAAFSSVEGKRVSQNDQKNRGFLDAQSFAQKGLQSKVGDTGSVSGEGALQVQSVTKNQYASPPGLGAPSLSFAPGESRPFERWVLEVNAVEEARLLVTQAVVALSGATSSIKGGKAQEEAEGKREEGPASGLTLQVWIGSERLSALEYRLGTAYAVTRMRPTMPAEAGYASSGATQSSLKETTLGKGAGNEPLTARSQMEGREVLSERVRSVPQKVFLEIVLRKK